MKGNEKNVEEEMGKRCLYSTIKSHDGIAWCLRFTDMLAIDGEKMREEMENNVVYLVNIMTLSK